MGPVMGSLKDSGHRIFGETIDQQTAWLQVPAVNTVGSGTFKSPVPNGRLALLAFLPIAPHLARYIPMADQISVTCDMLEGTRIMNAQGHPMASLSQPQGEAYTMARVELVDEKQRPQGTQPPPPVPWLSFFVADVLLPLVSLPIYRKGVRRAWGEAPPPPGAKMRRWLPWVGAIMALIAGVGVWRRIRRGRRK
jgi:hypothetical protein